MNRIKKLCLHSWNNFIDFAFPKVSNFWKLLIINSNNFLDVPSFKCSSQWNVFFSFSKAKDFYNYLVKFLSPFSSSSNYFILKLPTDSFVSTASQMPNEILFPVCFKGFLHCMNGYLSSFFVQHEINALPLSWENLCARSGKCLWNGSW